MNEIPGEDWKESSVTRRDVVRYIKMKDKLLVNLPWYQVPIETYIVAMIPNGEYVKVASPAMGQQWCKRSQIEVLAILPALKPQPLKKGPGEKGSYETPPWLDCLDQPGGGE